MKTKLIYADIPRDINLPQGDWFFEKRSFGGMFDFLVVTDLGGKSILGFVLAQGLEDSEIKRFFGEWVNQNGLPSGVYSNRGLKIRDIRLLEGETSGGGADALEYCLIYDILGLTTNKYKKWRQWFTCQTLG